MSQINQWELSCTCTSRTLFVAKYNILLFHFFFMSFFQMEVGLFSVYSSFIFKLPSVKTILRALSDS